ncbi:hypothetical protein G9P44_002030 [Scheffersomyces stipitis]|nr:hypothetical protein G9P44_002030 [Scheffersomyces stipitis]
MTHKKVIVIGGGISGIKTALDLYNGGVQDTLVLEARDRLGGRLLSIQSTNSNDKRIKYDLGASWFHDALNNPLFERSIEKGNVDYYYDDGKCIYFSKDEKDISTWRFSATLDEFMAYSQFVYKQNPSKPDISLKELSEEYVQKYKDRLTQDQIKYGLASVRMWAELWQGESWDKLSAKYCFGGDHLGRNVYVKNGYVTVFNNELVELPQSYRENNIKLNTRVTTIDYTSSKYIEITTSRNEKYTCDYVVSTIPQSLLTINDLNDPCYIKWIPSLPRHISSIMPSVKFSSLGKVVLEFDSTFWPTDVERFYCITDGVPSSSSDSKSIKPWQYPTILINYHKLAGTSTLVALTQNPLSAYIEGLLGGDKDTKIWEIFQPLLQNISGLTNIPAPKRIYHTPWNNDKYARGSYSTTLVGCDDPSEVVNAFVEGIEDRVRFAGSETVDGSANGCAHGGWFSGEREANFILNMIRKERVASKL